MIFYEVEPFNIVQFNYYGDDTFIVKLFKEYGIESKYPITNVASYFESEKGRKWRMQKFIHEHSSMEFDKNAALFNFNGLQNICVYYEIDIHYSCNDDIFHRMVS